MAEADQATAINPKYAAQYLRDEVLAAIRTELVKPWKAMSESDQEWAASKIETVCKNAIVRITQVIAEVGPMAIPAKFGKLGTDKDGCAVVPVTFAGDLEDDEKLGIWAHINKAVVVILLDPAEFSNFATKVEITPDQPRIPGTEGQPNWPVVADAIKDNGPDVVDVDDMDDTSQLKMTDGNEGDEPGAGDVGEEVETPATSGVDDLVEDDMDQEQVQKLVDIPNPTTKGKRR